MNIVIRQEKKVDFQKVSEVVEQAFQYEEMSDHREYLLVEKLRKTDAFIPELSLVAEHNKEIVGHILLTRVKIVNQHGSFDSLALAPVSVKPKYQNLGFGGQLITAAHRKATKLGFSSIVVLGHANYYPRFGYALAVKYGIELPFWAPDINCMVIALTKNGLNGVHGKVEYDKVFYK